MQGHDPEGVKRLSETGLLDPAFEESMKHAVCEWLGNCVPFTNAAPQEGAESPKAVEPPKTSEKPPEAGK